jgi:hypothetical protein
MAEAVKVLLYRSKVLVGSSLVPTSGKVVQTPAGRTAGDVKSKDRILTQHAIRTTHLELASVWNSFAPHEPVL